MSDVLFRYLLTARRRDRSVLRRLVFADEPMLAAGVEQLVESAAARVEVTSQHERVGRYTVTVPESRHRSVLFYEVAEPDRPREGRFERRRQEFPLRPTFQIFTCTTCGGRGEVRCSRCSGAGKVMCSTCGASSRGCPGCRGSGKKRCSPCSGRGRVRCPTCAGEGQLASWEVEVYQWLIERRSGEELPLAADQRRVRRAFHRWLRIDPDRVTSLAPEAAAEHLGHESPEALEVVARAEARRLRLEDEARRSADRYLFHDTERSLAPAGYTLLRLRGKARTYWLVGRGERAREVIPRGRPDGWKCLGWLGLPTGGAIGYDGVVQAWDLAQPVIAGLMFGELPLAWLAGGTAVSWLLTLTGVRRARRRPRPVLTVGLVEPAGRPTAYLTCLAYLGSYLGRLEVGDRAYDVQSRRLLGRMRPDRRSDSLAITLPDGRRVRLVEVARPHLLSAAQVRLMARALDAVMILRSKGATARDLAERIASAADPPPRIGTLRLDGDGADPRDSGRGLPLEAIRRAFLSDIPSDLDWQAVFDRLWRPLDDLLEDAGGRRRRRP